MNNGTIHDRELIQVPEAYFRGRDIDTRLEVHAPGCCEGFIDLVALIDKMPLAIEAERTSKRVARDLHKAQQINAIGLWIIVPNPAVARSVRRQLTRLRVKEHAPHLLVMTPGMLRRRIDTLLQQLRQRHQP